MNEKRLNEIKTRKAEIKADLEDTTKDIDLDATNKELDALNAEEEKLQKRAEMAKNLETGEVDPDNVETIPGTDEDEEDEGGKEDMKEEKRTSKMSKEVRSFLKYMMTGGKETRGVTLANGQAVVPEELDNEIITEMREVSDVMTFIN